MRKLAMLSGARKGAEFPLAKPQLSLGRAAENTICLDDDDVSRHHATLTREGREYRLRDLNSANGTIVNGQRVADALLRPGDEVRIGLVRIRYDGGSATGAGKRWLWAAVVAVDLAVVAWVVNFVTDGRWREFRSPAAHGQGSVAAGSRPVAETYRDPKGRFACEVPAGWIIVEDRGDPRSKLRLVNGADEIRIIAQRAAATALEESDRQAATRSFTELLERARAAGADGRLLTAAWRGAGTERALVVELEMRPPEYLWMRQWKFRAHGLDHTVAVCVAAPERRPALTEMFEQFLRGYRSLPQAPQPAVAAATPNATAP